MAPTDRDDNVAESATLLGPRRGGRPALDTSVPPIRGERIGRFTVLEPLGEGGMGVVVSAYDPQLDRRVAIKLVRTAANDPDERSEKQQRLLREARAMSRLRHPNVVAVYEADVHDRRVYVAMEQVGGGSLRDVLKRRREQGDPAGWREVIGYFRAAGGGLAAAHAKGMVHRDFKLDNVFFDDDGRVLVGDFGLVGAASTETRAASGDAGAVQILGDRITRHDEVVGTPAYMAPEQQLGQPVDDRADQFSFCASLYEALYGQLPFGGADRESYFDAVTTGKLRPPPPGNTVPAWVNQVIARGLRFEPERRYPSMDALLAEFSQDDLRSAYRGRITLIVASLLAVFAFAAANLIAFEISHFNNGARALAVLVVILAIAFAHRDAILRSAVNRKILFMALAALACSIIFLIGGSILAMDPLSTLTLNNLIWLTASASFTATAVPRLFPVPLAYLAAFVIGLARPEATLLATTAAHAIHGIAVFVHFRARPAAPLGATPGGPGRAPPTRSPPGAGRTGA